MCIPKPKAAEAQQAAAQPTAQATVVEPETGSPAAARKKARSLLSMAGGAGDNSTATTSSGAAKATLGA